MGWGWDQSVGRYRDTDTGKLLPGDTVRQWNSDLIAASENPNADLAKMVADNSISVADWNTAMREQIKDAYVTQYLTGVGGQEQMTQKDWGSVGGMLSDQYHNYLADFQREITMGNLSEAQIKARMDLYISSSKQAYEKANNRTQDNKGMTEERWVLGDAEHCFPPGTMIDTPDGLRSIESIQLGEMVCTLLGYRMITKIYRRPYYGAMICIRSDNQEVTCTPNHPFLTHRGWVRADQLLTDDSLMFYKNRPDQFNRKFAFPYSDNGIAASGQVGFLGAVSHSLLDLPFYERFKSGMAVPPVSIGLDDERTNFEINNELGLNKEISLIDYANRIKHSGSSLFKFARFIFLKAGITSHKLSQHIGAIGRRLANPFMSAWHMGRIMFSHIGGRFGMDYAMPGCFSQSNVKDISLITHLLKRFANSLTNYFSTKTRIIGNQIISFFLSPNGMPYSGYGIMLSTIGTFPISSISAYGAPLHNLGGIKPRVMGVSTSKGTKPSTQRFTPIVGNSKRFATQLTVFGNSEHGLHPYNDIQIVYPIEHNESNIVYNLEVEEAHHYVANGFVVHNCTDCVALANQDWVALGEISGHQVPGDGSTLCNVNCKCQLEYR